MKWIIVLVIILALIVLILNRYRKHLQTAWFMWRTFRKFKQQTRPKQKQVPKKDTSADTELVRCPKCSKWTPQDEAVKLKKVYYCSLPCLEESISVSK